MQLQTKPTCPTWGKKPKHQTKKSTRCHQKACLNRKCRSKSLTAVFWFMDKATSPFRNTQEKVQCHPLLQQVTCSINCHRVFRSRLPKKEIKKKRQVHYHYWFISFVFVKLQKYTLAVYAVFTQRKNNFNFWFQGLKKICMYFSATAHFQC